MMMIEMLGTMHMKGVEDKMKYEIDNACFICRFLRCTSHECSYNSYSCRKIKINLSENILYTGCDLFELSKEIIKQQERKAKIEQIKKKVNFFDKRSM